jgi:hypothetical protein
MWASGLVLAGEGKAPDTVHAIVYVSSDAMPNLRLFRETTDGHPQFCTPDPADHIIEALVGSSRR